jgi:cell wall-associated NlpC family hydrolase
LNFNIQEKDDTIQAGFTDVFIEVAKDSNQANIEGEEKTLSSPVISLNGEVFVSKTSLQEILGTGADVTLEQDQLSIYFNELDNYGFPKDVNLNDLQVLNDRETSVVPALASETADRIIRFGLKYKGVPYVFGASSGRTDIFDCSSFTQYVYGKYGIDLPRISRHQAKLGTYVPVKDLQKGDLLFFYWPGRFKSNDIVGHVGIYVGDGYMLHSSPNTPYTVDGVQLTDLTDPKTAFREMYLGAKRVR